MEILLEILLEFVGEILIQLVFQVLVEIGMHVFAEPFRQRPSPPMAALAYGIFGCAIGGLSLLVFPASLIPSMTLRWVNLVATPLACGGAMAAMGAWRRKRGEELLRIDRFAYGFLFAVSVALVRFLFAH